MKKQKAAASALILALLLLLTLTACDNGTSGQTSAASTTAEEVPPTGGEPTAAPEPTDAPTDAISDVPTDTPTDTPTAAPTAEPTAAPTEPVTEVPTEPVTGTPTAPIDEPPAEPTDEGIEYRVGRIAEPEITEEDILFVLSPDGTGVFRGPFDTPAEYDREELASLGFHGTRLVLTPYLAYHGPAAVENDLATLTIGQALMRIDVEGDVPHEELFAFFTSLGGMAPEAAEQLLAGSFFDAGLFDPELGALRGTITFRLSEQLKIAELVRTMMFTEEGRYLIQEIDEDGWVTETEYNADGTVYDGTICEYSEDGKLLKMTVISWGEIESVTEFYPNECPKTRKTFTWYGGWEITEYAEDGTPISEVGYNSDGSVNWEKLYFPNGSVRSETDYGPGGILLGHSEYYEDGSFAVIDRYYDNGKPERHTEYFPNGEIRAASEWYENGRLRSLCENTEDGHTVRQEDYYPDGSPEYLFFAGSETEPAREEVYDETGRLIYETTYEFVGDETIRTIRSWSSYSGAYTVTVTRFNADGNEIIETVYDADGKISRVTEFDPVTGNPVSEEYYDDGVLYCRNFFDENGNLIRTEYFESDGSVVRETYDENGKTIEVICYGTDGKVEYAVYTEYDAEGNRTKSVTVLGDGESTETEIYANGDLVSRETVRSDGGRRLEEYDPVTGERISSTEWTIDGSVRYFYGPGNNIIRTETYDTEGRLTQYSESELNGFAVLRTVSYLADGTQLSYVEYDENGRIRIDEMPDYEYGENQDGEWVQLGTVPIGWDRMEFDENGRLIGYTRFDALRRISSYSVTEYYPNGQEKIVTYFRGDGSVDFWNEYDENGIQTVRGFTDADSGICWVNELDANGVVRRSINMNPDGTKNTETENDENGVTRRVTFYWPDGTVEVVEYDENGMAIG